ncbi:MAG: FAD/NAD(P)-binding protein, partial [Phycisphaerales bacterium]
LFGEYLLETVAAALAEAGDRIALVRDAVVHVDRLPSRIELLLASGRSTVADAVIVAPGMPPARAPWNRVDHGAPRGALIADPWETGAFEGIDPGAEVLVLGSGLTAIDVAQGLRRAGHVGVIRMVSRNGRLPLAHAVLGEPAATIDPAALGGGPSAVMHAVRALARARAKAGLGWQGAVDAIRPHATAVWQSWTPAQRRRFLRHARPAWEVHRHRAPRAVLDDLGQQMLDGTIVVERGALAALHPAPGDAVEVQVKGPDGVWRSHRVARIPMAGPMQLKIRATRCARLPAPGRRPGSAGRARSTPSGRMRRPSGSHGPPRSDGGSCATRARHGKCIATARGALVALHPASGDAVEAQVKGPDGVWRSHRVARIFNCIGP